MSINSIYSIFFILITIFITILFVRRLGEKSGCITYGYIGLILFCINLFFIFSWGFFYSASGDTFKVISSGENHTATVIGYDTKKVHNYESGQNEAMNTPTVRFMTDNEETIEIQLDFSTSGVEIGDAYKINYNESNGRVITLGFPFIIKLSGAFIFCFIFTFLFMGEILFALNRQMDWFYSVIKIVGMYFFLPFMMIGFDALLVYGLFYGNDVPFFVSAILVFFILVLTLAIVGMLKMIFTEGLE